MARGRPRKSDTSATSDSEISKKKPHADAAYRQVMDDLRLRIARGEWREGERIPTVDELEQEYPFSRMTVFRAVRELKTMGVLRTRNRAGTVVARASSRGRVGVLFPLNFKTPAHAEFTYRVAQLVRERAYLLGFDPVMFEEAPSPYPQNVPSAAMMDDLKHGRLQAIISVQSFFPHWRLDTRPTIRVPHVDIGIFPTPYQVYINYEDALERAVNHLLPLKRDCIGLIGNIPPQKNQLKKLAHQHRFAVFEEWLRTDPTQMNEAYGFRALHEIWQAEDKPTALFISDDVIAQGVAQAALALNIRVPEDLRLVCMANKGIERFYPCPVDRVEIDLEQLASGALSILRSIQDGLVGEKEQRMIRSFDRVVCGKHMVDVAALR